MRRLLVISAGIVGVVVVAIVAAWVVLFHTPPGRAFIIAQLEPRIGAALGGEAEIGALRGALPGAPILEDVTLTDDAGVWLTIGRIEMGWRPLQLLGGDIDIDRLRIVDAHLLREPPGDGPKEEQARQRLSLQLPDDLPALRIGDLDIENFRSDLGGRTARLDGVGAVIMGGARIDASLRLTSENDRDIVDVTIERAPRAGRLYIDATVAGAEDGVIAAFAGLGGPIYLEIKSDGPPRDATLAVDGTIGAHGEIHATLAGDTENLRALDITGDFAPGSALSDMTELSRPLAFDLRIEEKDGGGVLRIARLTSAVGELSGVLEWRNSRAVTDHLSADLEAAFAEDYRAQERAVIGGAAALKATVRRRGDRYAFEATLDSDRMRAVVTDGTTNFDNFFAGDLEGVFKSREDFFLLDAPAEVRARVDIDTETRAELGGLVVTRADGSTLEGDAVYRFDDEAIEFDGDITAAPALVASFVPSLTATDFVDATVSFSGPVARFRLEADIDAPAMTFNDNPVPPLTASIALAGLPDLPAGEVTAQAKEGSGRLEAVLRSSESGRIALTRLAYAGENFNLNGTGALNPQTDVLEIDLSYEGEEGASPWPGVTAEGAFNIAGTVSREGRRTDLRATAESFSLNDIAAENLTLTAKGPSDAVQTTLQAASLTLPTVGRVEDLSMEAGVDLSAGPDIALNALSGVATDNSFSLRQPAQISLQEGVAVTRLRLGWGRAGAIALDGAITNERWRAMLALSDANVPGADGRITLDLDLDTDRETPARGTFEFSSLLTQTQEAAIAGRFIWDGQQLVLTSAQDAEAMDMRIALPARLTRQPSLGVETEGAIDGYARYDGRVEVIAAYLPPTLQTLEGALTADVQFSGATNAPEISGSAAIDDGAYTELETGLSFAGLHMEAWASYGDERSVMRFSGGARGAGQTREDAITLSGELTLAETLNLALTVNLDRAELSAHPVTDVRASGRVDLSGALDSLKAEGEITIIELNAEIDVPEDTGLVPITVVAYDAERPAGETEDDVRPASGVDYDITVTADDRIFIRGRGLESEWSADVRASNQDGSPLILGQMNLRRGWLDFAGRRFTLARGSVAFDRLSPNNPRLDIRAEYETDEGVTAIIALSGRAEAPNIELSSVPSRPSEDVMALVLFGKPAGELTALESLQTAQALASLGGVGPFGGGGGGVTGALRQATGLDLLNIDVDPEGGGGSLTVGKYVTQGLFVSATQDARGEAGAVRVEYEITDNITVETEVEQDGDQTVSANWKRDF